MNQNNTEANEPNLVFQQTETKFEGNRPMRSRSTNSTQVRETC